MSTDAKPDLVMQELARYEATGELLPGAAEALRGPVGAGLQNAAADRVAEQVAERLRSDFAKRYVNPERPEPEAPRSPLRVALERYRDRLTGPEVIDELVTRWSAELAGLMDQPGRLAAEVTRRLGDHRNNEYLRVINPLPARERRVLDAAYRFHDVLDPQDVARRRATELGHLPEEQVVRALGRLLVAQGKIRGDDPRLKAPSGPKGPDQPRPSRI